MRPRIISNSVAGLMALCVLMVARPPYIALRPMTDESNLYDDIKRLLPHRSVRHADEYVTGDGIHAQGIENFWSILKRQLYGTHHHVEAGFLNMYADEAAFKFNTRKMSDGERFAYALQHPEGRLTWYFGKRAQKVS